MRKTKNQEKTASLMRFPIPLVPRQQGICSVHEVTNERQSIAQAKTKTKNKLWTNIDIMIHPHPPLPPSPILLRQKKNDKNSTQ
jgi:quinolinate synthase